MTTTQESDQVLQRRANLEELRRLGVDPYPNRFDSQASIEEIVRAHGGKSGEELEAAQIKARVAALTDEEAAAHLALARAQLALGQFEDARAEATQAVESRERMDAPESLWLADARLVLAESLWRLGDKAGARQLVTLARQAHAAQVAVGPQYSRPLSLLESLTR